LLYLWIKALHASVVVAWVARCCYLRRPFVPRADATGWTSEARLKLM